MPNWVAAFAPYLEREFQVQLETRITFPAGRVIAEVPAAFLRFPMWQGEPFVDDFGKKSSAMIDLNGEHLFAELAVLRLLEKDGWEGRWVNTYGGKGEVWKYLTRWDDVPRAEQKTRPIQADEPRQLLARLAGFNKPRRYKGCWDVFAWRGDAIAFVECKRTTPKSTDVVSKEKEEWVRSALFLGDPRLTVDSFCFVQWDFS
jgi:hypothetical protein